MAAGKASHVGQPISREHIVLPMALFFDKVVKINPQDPDSGLEGIGRFNVEMYTLHLLGLPGSKPSSSAWGRRRGNGWVFDSLLPFLVIMGFSLITDPGDPGRGGSLLCEDADAGRENLPEDDKRELELSSGVAGRGLMIRRSSGSRSGSL